MGLALGVTFKQDVEKIDKATAALFDYAHRVKERRTRPPGDDFVSLLLQANEDKDRLSDQELYDMVVLAVFGGIDTTRNQLGLAMSVFIENPDQWRLLVDRPELARSAVEEVMRVRPTTTWITREAMEDFTYNDLGIKRGTTIHLFSESAGTDPQQYAPDFDITAQRKPHFGFGGGPHHCLGHFIARADMTEGPQGVGEAYQKSAARGRADVAAGQREYRPHQAPHRFRPGILSAACGGNCETGNRPCEKSAAVLYHCGRSRCRLTEFSGCRMTPRGNWAGTLI
jgi:cytochrome P450